MPETLIFLIICTFGAAVGSFLNVVILRLPQDDKSIVFPASHCPECEKQLYWYDNIPLLSYVFLLGKCRFCKEKISLQYPLVELIMTALTAALYGQFALTVAFFIYFVFCAALVAIIFIDFHHQIIPDVISLPGIILGFLASFVNPYVSWQSSGLGILIGGGTLYCIAMGYYLLTKREGMGGGDIKLLAMIGAFLGWPSLPIVLFSSSFIGSIIGIGAMVQQKKGGKTVIPFGPFLSLGSLIYLFFQKDAYRLLFMLTGQG